MTTEFTPLASTIGGALIGLSAVLLMLLSGRIAGISGIVSRAMRLRADNASLQSLAFVAGLIGAPFLWTTATGASVSQTVTTNLALAGVAGLLVGFGAAFGGGCTSGHGVCGLARLSKRSLVAVLTFIAAAIAVVFIARHILGGSL